MQREDYLYTFIVQFENTHSEFKDIKNSKSKCPFHVPVFKQESVTRKESLIIQRLLLFCAPLISVWLTKMTFICRLIHELLSPDYLLLNRKKGAISGDIVPIHIYSISSCIRKIIAVWRLTWLSLCPWKINLCTSCRKFQS